MVAEFEADLIRLRTREGMKVAKAKGHLRGKQPKLSRRQEAHLVSLIRSGDYSTAEVAELFGVARSTVYRAIERDRGRARADARVVVTASCPAAHGASRTAHPLWDARYSLRTPAPAAPYAVPSMGTRWQEALCGGASFAMMDA